MDIISLKELQKKFNTVLETVSDKNILIDFELNEIVNYLNYTPPPKKGRFDYRPEPKTDSIFKLGVPINFRPLFKKAFNNILLYGEYKINESDTLFKEIFKIKKNVIEQAHILVKYQKWISNIEVIQKSNSDKSTLNIEQKLLALQLLGLDLRDYKNNHSAKILGQILNVGSENIRKNLPNIYFGKNNVRNIENFEKLSELFENKTFESISNRIKKEINTLKIK